MYLSSWGLIWPLQGKKVYATPETADTLPLFLLYPYMYSTLWSALSPEVYTTTLYVMVGRVKGGGRATPTLTWLGWFYHHDRMYARKWPLPLCVYSVGWNGLRTTYYDMSVMLYVWPILHWRHREFKNNETLDSSQKSSLCPWYAVQFIPGLSSHSMLLKILIFLTAENSNILYVSVKSC